jgi:hypothetical protein
MGPLLRNVRPDRQLPFLRRGPAEGSDLIDASRFFPRCGREEAGGSGDKPATIDATSGKMT